MNTRVTQTDTVRSTSAEPGGALEGFSEATSTEFPCTGEGTWWLRSQRAIALPVYPLLQRREPQLEE